MGAVRALVLLALAAAAAAQPAPAPGLSQEAQQALLGVVSPSGSALVGPDAAQPAALAPGAQVSACPEETILVYADQLVNLTQTTCNEAGALDDQNGRFERGVPFGFAWNDTLPSNCTIFSMTIALQAGISCTGLPAGGNVTLNGQLLPQKYRFPYMNEYAQTCSCDPPAYSPVQVFNNLPSGVYSQGGRNVLSILGSTGANGLRPLVPLPSGGVYAVVIVNQWAKAPNMQVPRTNFGYAGTPAGGALAAGGVSSGGLPTDTAEEFNRSTQTWQLSTGRLQSAVYLNQVANLQATGGADSSGAYYLISAGGINAAGQMVAAMDVYNTSGKFWTPGPPMQQARARFQLTSLLNRTNAAIASGGIVGSAGETTVLGSVETYDLDRNTFILGPNNMSTPRYRHTASLLPSWQLLLAGGQGADGAALNSSELLELELFTFANGGAMNHARYAHTATVLANGSVLVTGGAQKPNSDATWANSDLLSSCELWSPGVGWRPVGSLVSARAEHVAVLQSDGTVLVTGGATNGGAAAPSAEIWNPANGQWTSAAPMLAPRVRFGVVKFADDRSILFGGALNASQTLVSGSTTAQLFSPALNSTLLLAAAAPVVAPALSPAVAASVPLLNASSTVAPPPPPNGIASQATPPDSGIYIYASEGISTGAVIGIVVGAIGGFTLLLLVIFFVFRHCQRKQRAQRRPAANASKHPSAGTRSSGSSSRSNSELGEAADRSGLTGGALSGRSTVGLGFFRKLSSFVKKDSRGSAGEAPAPMAHAPSVEMPKGMVSPFDAPATAAAEPEPHSSSQRSVELAIGLPSPFASQPSTVSTSGQRSDPVTGNSYAVTTQNTAHSRSEAEDRVEALSTSGGGRQVTRSAMRSAESTRSDLSRVSVTIQNELHAAEWKIDRDALELGRRLGKGGFGEVFEGMHHGSAVAVKVLEINDERTMLDACHEFGFLHGLRHSKLVISYGACVDGNKMLLVMERMEEDLFHAIASDQTAAGDSVLWYFRGWKIAVDVASSLVFLHSKGMIHLDVKSLNILLRGKRAEAKLGDLGLARMVPEGALFLQNTLPGTPAYSAPEVIQAQLQWRLRTQGRKDQFKTEVGTPADIFAFGVVLFEICTGCHPARWRQEFTGELRPEQGPPAIAKLIDDCLNDEAHLRPTAQQVLKILLENKPPNYRD